MFGLIVLALAVILRPARAKCIACSSGNCNACSGTHCDCTHPGGLDDDRAPLRP